MPRVDFPLYLVTDRHQTVGRPLLAVLRDAVAVGVPAIQVRERDLQTRDLLNLSTDLMQITRGTGTKIFINDRLDLVMGLQADGVHLRSSSLAVSTARRVLGARPLVGVSVHAVVEVIRAEAEGADFAVFGPIYPTPSKAAYGVPLGLGPLEEAARRSRIPIFAIGGITAKRAAEVRQAGAYGVAVISCVLSAESVATATQILLDAVSPGKS